MGGATTTWISELSNRLWLLLLIPIALYMAYTWKSSGMRFIGKGTILFVLRCMAIVLLVFALAIPYVTLRADEEQILFVVDRSVSSESAGNMADKWITESLKARQANQSVGLYSFAETFRTDIQLTDADVTVPAVDRWKRRMQTNIANAIDLAAAVAKKNSATRIMLLSDGLETVGSVEELLPKYADGRVTIDTVLLERPNNADASISIFDTPRTAYEGEKQLLASGSGIIHSNGR